MSLFYFSSDYASQFMDVTERPNFVLDLSPLGTSRVLVIGSLWLFTELKGV